MLIYLFLMQIKSCTNIIPFLSRMLMACSFWNNLIKFYWDAMIMQSEFLGDWTPLNALYCSLFHQEYATLVAFQLSTNTLFFINTYLMNKRSYTLLNDCLALIRIIYFWVIPNKIANFFQKIGVTPLAIATLLRISFFLQILRINFLNLLLKIIQLIIIIIL